MDLDKYVIINSINWHKQLLKNQKNCCISRNNEKDPIIMLINTQDTPKDLCRRINHYCTSNKLTTYVDFNVYKTFPHPPFNNLRQSLDYLFIGQSQVICIYGSEKEIFPPEVIGPVKSTPSNIQILSPLLTHPKPLNKLNCKSKCENNEMIKSWDTLLNSRHFEGKGAC
jgi:hypothetical protein